jgi:hypothetical protein
VSNFAPKRTSYDTGDRRWLRDPIKSERHGVSVVAADVVADGTGLVKSGSIVTGEGLVLDNFVIKAGETHLISVVHAGTVDRRYLPAALTAAQETALSQNGISFINGNVPA